MSDQKTVPFPTAPARNVEGTVTINYNLQTQALNVKAVNLPNELVIFVLDAAKHVLLHSLKMVPGDAPIVAAPVEEKK